jgi:hypothetical protein
MVVIHDGPLTPDKSYDIPFEPARPFWVMEYISKSSELKDFEISFKKYEEYLKVPYYLLFYPENQELTLFRLGDTKYVSVKPNRKGRCAIPELDLEVAIHNGWCRYWYQNKLLPLPADLLHHVESLERKLAAERKHRRAEAKRAEQEAKRAEQEKRLRLNSEEELRMLRAELEQLKGRQS